MKVLVVLSMMMVCVAQMARASLVVGVQPAHHPALVLDAHGRPLDTAEVVAARSHHLLAKHLEHAHAPLVAHAPLAAAVSHQSRVDVHSSPAVLAHSYHAHPLLAHSALGLGHGHWLHKRSLGHLAYAAPVVSHVAHVAPAAVSHQSRVDVISSPAVVSHAVHAAPLVHAVHAPVVSHVAHVAPAAAVSHQSRVDVRTSHPVVSHAVHAAPVVHAVHAAPVVSAHSAWPAYGHGYGHGLGYGHGYGHGLGHGYGLSHLLKKRSLALAHVLPAAVSHQSRVDVISSHAAPITIAHVAHVAPVVSHLTPLAHSAVWTAPASHWAHSPLAFSGHW